MPSPEQKSNQNFEKIIDDRFIIDKSNFRLDDNKFPLVNSLRFVMKGQSPEPTAPTPEPEEIVRLRQELQALRLRLTASQTRSSELDIRNEDLRRKLAVKGQDILGYVGLIARLKVEVANQATIITQLGKQLAEARRQTQTQSSSEGPYKVLGIDPAFARTLSQEQFKAYVTRVRNAHAMFAHSDTGGNDNLMAKMNNAVDELLKSRGIK